MPNRKNKNKTKRRPRRGQGRRGSANRRGRGQFVPNEMHVTMRLSGHVDNAASSTYAEAGFTINDMFDPQGGSGAAQCLGFDQMAVLYNRYRVTGSTIKVRASLNSDSGTPTATALEAQVVVYPASVVTGATTVDDGMSQPFVKSSFISGEKPVTLRSSCSVAKLIGNSVTADRLQAVVTSSPSKILYWHVGIISRAYTGIRTTLAVEVTYQVTFFERNLLDRSTLFLLHDAVVKTRKMQDEKEAKGPQFINWQKSPPQPTVDSKEHKEEVIAPLRLAESDYYVVRATPKSQSVK